MDQPLVSVIMSVYNGAAYLRDAVDSILGQTYEHFELLVIDDGSSDETRVILESYVDSRLRLLVNEVNQGLTRSLNRMLGEVRGEYVARQDADDVSLADRLERQVAYMQAYQGIDLLGGGYIVVDRDGNVQESFGEMLGPVQLRWLMLFHNAFCHSTVMLRRSAIPAEGLYNPDMRYAQDFDAWSRLLALGCGGANLAEPLILYRRHGDSISCAKREEQQMAADIVCMRNLERLMGATSPPLVQIPWLREFFFYGRNAVGQCASVDGLRVYYRVLAAYLQSVSIENRLPCNELWRREIRRGVGMVKARHLSCTQRLRLALFSLWVGQRGWRACA